MAISTTREALHRLIDALPEATLDDAARYLEALSTDDPVLRSILLAPEDEEPEGHPEGVKDGDSEARGAARCPCKSL